MLGSCFFLGLPHPNLFSGYFVHFGTAAFLVELARRTRTKLRPFFDQGLGKRKKVYDIIGVLIIKCMMGYSTLPNLADAHFFPRNALS